MFSRLQASWEQGPYLIYVVSFSFSVPLHGVCVYMRAKSLQSCPAFCNLMDCSPPGSSVHGILQERILEWVAMPSSWGSSSPRDRTHITSPALAGRFFTTSATWEALACTAAAAAAAKSLQSCPTLCDPIDGSPPGSAAPGILQARTLEWVAISFSNAGKWKLKVKSLSHVWLLATPWTAAYQAPPSMGFSRQEYWSGVPSPSPLSHITPLNLPSLTLL